MSRRIGVMPFHKVAFRTENGITNIIVDGHEIRRCVGAELKWELNAIPTVKLELLATDIFVNIEEAKVEEEKHEGD